MKVLKKILSILFSIIGIGLLLLITIGVILKINLRQSKIEYYLKNNDMSFLLKNTDGTDNEFVSQIKELCVLVGIPDDTVEAMLNSDATKEFASKYMVSLFDYLIYQKIDNTITDADIKNVVIQNYDVINDKMKEKGLEFAESDRQAISDLLDKYTGTLVDYFPSASTLFSELDQSNVQIYQNITLQDVTTGIRILTSKEYMITFGICFIVCCIIILLLNQGRQCFHYFNGISIMYTIIISILQILFNTTIQDKLIALVPSAKEFMIYFIHAFSEYLWIFILFGIIFILLFSILGKGKNNEKVFN